MRIAGTRAEVDSVATHLAGTYAPTTKELWTAVIQAILFAMIGPVAVLATLNDDPAAREDWWFMVLFAAGSPAVGMVLLFHSTATYVVDRSSFARRNIIPVGNWSVHLADVHAIDLDPGWSHLEITTTADRKRPFLLREAAREKLEKVPRPAEPQGIDTAHQPRSLLWYSSAVTVLSIAAVVLDLSLADRRLHWVFRIAVSVIGRLGAIGALFGLVGIVWSLMLRGVARDPNAATRYRVILYSILALAVIAFIIAIVVLHRAGLQFW
ncbi:MAG TPA: hypothetical protein VGF28_17115 [Thermoanaerobaculia bacterium]